LTLLTHTAGIGFADLLELRRALEVPAAGLAAARRTAPPPAPIRGGVFGPALDDFDVMIQAHTAFHEAVAKATGNPLFELVTRPLYHVSYGEELIEALPEDYWARIDADHRELLECLKRSDADAAITAARR